MFLKECLVLVKLFYLYKLTQVIVFYDNEINIFCIANEDHGNIWIMLSVIRINPGVEFLSGIVT